MGRSDWPFGANICSTSRVAPLSRRELNAAARALKRAADHFEQRALQMDDRVAGWRKDHRHDDAPVVASTLHSVARQLHQWADRCQEP